MHVGREPRCRSALQSVLRLHWGGRAVRHWDDDNDGAVVHALSVGDLAPSPVQHTSRFCDNEARRRYPGIPY